MNTPPSIWLPAAALEASASPGSVALLDRLGLRERVLGGERAHASDLLPALQELLIEAGAAARELRAIVVGTGPGSFTGIRVAAASALGLARGSAARLVAVPSCEALMYAQLRPGETAAWIHDMRSSGFAWARYQREARELRPLEPLRLLTAEEVRGRLQPAESVYANAATAQALRSVFKETLSITPSGGVPAAALLELGLSRLERDGPDVELRLEPLYLREFAASVRRQR